MSDWKAVATLTLGIVAAGCTSGSWIPQALRTIRTRSAGDFAWSYLMLFGGGVVLWMIYGLLRRDLAVFGANLVTLVLVARIVMVKRLVGPAPTDAAAEPGGGPGSTDQ